ncbi:MAG: tRNA 4-thiouridine(8) synthase ThiI [Clostridiales bacterium]|nr:tRNA 4-thiouridine(8) synthase ThiI [Clostridiales bacterium]
MHVILIKYAEIHLKGLNRPFFERQLVKQIQRALAPLPARTLREQGRMYVYDVPEGDVAQAVDKLTTVFGIHAICPALVVEKDWPAIRGAAIQALRETEGDGPQTFKVFARRADKTFPMTSEQICRELGHDLLEACPWLRVDVKKPAISVQVEVRLDRAFLYTKEVAGRGGMPVGCNGKAMLLISGGIDSPVAGYLMAKRGVSLAAVHFFSFPYTSERARDKVVELTRLVAKYAGEIELFLVPFTEIQRAIYEKCPPTETTVLMRRLMMKIAERVANRCGAQVLVTGEAIGQVASQTIESLTVTNDACTLPVLRPLICFDKEEIVDLAKSIGTFQTSILPFEDCCTVFVPQHPVTKPKLERLRSSEALVDFEPMIEEALLGTIIEKISQTVCG